MRQIQREEENSLISIIIPVYNVQEYLQRCIESIMRQTYKNLEVVLVDDGSTDASGKLCDQAAKKDSRLKVIHQKNGGLSNARNHGLDEMHGQWVAFLDSDDYVSPCWIETLYGMALRNNADIAAGNLIRTKRDDEAFDQLNAGKTKEKMFSGKEAIANLYGEGENFITIIACNKLYAAKLFDGRRFREGIIHEDEELVWKLLYAASGIVATKKPLYAYYMSDNSIMRGSFSERQLIYLDILEERIAFFTEQREKKLLALTLKSKCYALQKFYCLCLKFIPKEKKLITRLRQEFCVLFPEVVLFREVPLKSKACLVGMRVAPVLYQKIRGEW